MSKLPTIPVITLDGPSGSGKGTVGLLLARKLGWHFLDSGALYRVLALAATNQHIDSSDENALAELAKTLDVHFNGDIFLEGERVNERIRSEQCGNQASRIAVFPAVRTALLERQRAFRQAPGLIADGRDMGTVVFPEAPLKFFLEADPIERAKRRMLQLKTMGQDVSLELILEEIKARDLRDRQRVIAPLVPAQDAVVIDTTGMGIETVFNQVFASAKQRLY